MQALLNAAAQDGNLVLDPMTPVINVSSALTVPLRDKGDFGTYINGNGLRLNSLITDKVTPVIRFAGRGRMLRVENIAVFGNDTCGNGFEFIGTDYQNGGGISQFSLKGLIAAYCGMNGFYFNGSFFEGSIYDVMTNGNALDGMVFDCTNSEPGGLSNIMMYGTNLSRNQGFGMSHRGGSDQVDHFGGSYVNNGLGGINAPTGLRLTFGVNGENTGEALITMPRSDWQSRVISCNMSSDGGWVRPNTGGKPSRYVVRGNPAKLTVTDGFVRPYNGSAMEVQMP